LSATTGMLGTALGATDALLGRLRSYLLPGGPASARGVRGIRTTQRGTIRSSAGARAVPFTAEEFVDATCSRFRWEARMGASMITTVQVTDAYEQGHGTLVVKKGPIPLVRLAGPDVDRGELQRYLGYVQYCPPLLFNNPDLEWHASGPLRLSVRDRNDATGATVEIEQAADGRPLITRAVRPMTQGKRSVLTSWSATGSDVHEWYGWRVARRLEASWHPPEGSFSYVQIELTSFEVLR
jgi:hypothetical protein